MTWTLADWWAGLIPFLVSITIWMNFKRSVHGWLLGAVVQAVQVAFGILTKHYLLCLCVIPMGVFLVAWVKAGRQTRGRQAPL